MITALIIEIVSEFPRCVLNFIILHCTLRNESQKIYLLVLPETESFPQQVAVGIKGSTEAQYLGILMTFPVWSHWLAVNCDRYTY